MIEIITHLIGYLQTLISALAISTNALFLKNPTLKVSDEVSALQIQRLRTLDRQWSELISFRTGTNQVNLPCLSVAKPRSGAEEKAEAPAPL